MHNVAYEKTTWKDHIVPSPGRYKAVDNGDGTFTLTPDFGTPIQTGTPLSAANHNKIEQGIADAHAIAEAALPKTGGTVGALTIETAGNDNLRQRRANWDAGDFIATSVAGDSVDPILVTEFYDASANTNTELLRQTKNSLTYKGIAVITSANTDKVLSEAEYGSDPNTLGGKFQVTKAHNSTPNRPGDYHTIVNFPASMNSDIQLSSFFGAVNAFFMRGRHDSTGNWHQWERLLTNTGYQSVNGTFEAFGDIKATSGGFFWNGTQMAQTRINNGVLEFYDGGWKPVGGIFAKHPRQATGSINTTSFSTALSVSGSGRLFRVMTNGSYGPGQVRITVDGGTPYTYTPSVTTRYDDSNTAGNVTLDISFVSSLLIEMAATSGAAPLINYAIDYGLA